MKKETKHKKIYRLRDEQENKPAVTRLQIALRVVFVFVFAFFALFTVFVSAAKLPAKAVVLSIPRGASISINMPVAKKDDAKIIEICRGTLKPKCLALAKNIVGVKKTVKIPATYLLGDAVIKVSVVNVGSGGAVKTFLLNKKVKIVAVKTSGGGGGGGGSGSGSASSAGDNDVAVINGGVPLPTPTPASGAYSGGNIIRATPTPTPQSVVGTKPILINH